jgi:ParB family chromosome partitioning protein
MTSQTLISIPISAIRPSQLQPRKYFDEEALESLKQSILIHGLLSPILVREILPNQYDIIAGERRYRAMKSLGEIAIPCFVTTLKEDDAIVIGLIENIQRESLTELEEAMSYAFLMQEYEYTQFTLSNVIKKSRSHIANMLRLLTLSSEVKDALNQKKITVGHARALIGLDISSQLYYLQKIVADNWSVRQIERAIQQHKKEKSIKQLPYHRDTVTIENALSLHLGTTVKIDAQNNGEGWIKIQFFDLDTFDGVLSHLGFQGDRVTKDIAF